MIIVDTSVWIDFFKNTDPGLTSILKKYLKKNHVFAVSAVFGELLQGVRNKREQEIILSFWQNLPKTDETDIFIKAGELSEKHKLYAKGVGLIDCYIIATAEQNNLAIWSLDKKLISAIDSITSEN
jgi:predicted nucleic acid-binding protein